MTGTSDAEVGARIAAETAARTSYGRLIALLASRSRDIAAAEDALSDAFAAALRVWPQTGVPQRPEAWLLTTARRRLGHGARAHRVHEAASEHIERTHQELQALEATDFPDVRLRLLFTCAHPAIDESIRTPLMLQTVLGLDAARIAGAFLVAPAAMGQRLVRAKAKIKDAGISFEAPAAADLPDRLADVLRAIYAAFTAGWDGPATPRADLTAEAIYLGRLVVQLLPGAPEALGLLALMLYCEARRPARRDAEGRFVPLAQQDTRRWSRDLIIEAETVLVAAAQIPAAPGRFRIEAAIQSVHTQRAITGTTLTGPLVTLYDLLVAHAPSTAAQVNRAAAHAEHFGPAAGLALLSALPLEHVEAYQPFWVVRLHLMLRLGHEVEAHHARARALDLTEDPAVRTYLAELR